MTELIKKYRPHFEVLQNSKEPVYRKAILRVANKKLIRAIGDCCRSYCNLKRGYNPKLGRKAKLLADQLKSSKLSTFEKRAKLVQRGGFIGALLGSLLPMIGSFVLNKIFNKK